MAYARRDGESLEAHAARLQALLEERDAQSLVSGELPAGSPLALGVANEVGAADGLEEAEALLAERSQSSQSPMVLQMLEGLQAAAVYTDTPNHETNRKLWDAYAKSWSSEQEWVRRMAGHLPGDLRELHTVGDEWADEASLQEVLKEWLLPSLSHVSSSGERAACRVAEIGSGGGRVAKHVAGQTSELVCFDISKEMLKAAEKHLASEGIDKVRFQHVDGDKDYPKEYDESFDVVYSFDVFVHMDLHQMRRTLCSIFKMLRPGGTCFVSFANLLAPDGWRRFARQQKYTVGGFYFVSPDIAKCLLVQAGFELCRLSAPQPGNTYLNRDLMVLARRPHQA